MTSRTPHPSRTETLMRPARGIVLACAMLACMSGTAGAQTPEKPVATGPAVGEQIPAFEAVDRTGARQTFESLRGPNGLLLLFFRSADW